MDRLDCFKTFIQVVEQGSFSKAARQLGISRDQVAKRICYLEGRLNVVLLARTTRSMVPTVAGERFYERCKVILSEYAWAVDEILYDKKLAEGELRISCPHDFGRLVLPQLLQGFNRQYPNMRFDVQLYHCTPPTDELIDAVFQLTSQAICEEAHVVLTSTQGFYASPEYFAQHGSPQQFEDLINHTVLCHTTNIKTQFMYLNRPYGGGFTPNFVCNDHRLIKDFCEQHFGIAFLPEFLVEESLIAHQLVECLDDYVASPIQLFVTPPNQKINSKIALLFWQYVTALDLDNI